MASLPRLIRMFEAKKKKEKEEEEEKSDVSVTRASKARKRKAKTITLYRLFNQYVEDPAYGQTELRSAYGPPFSMAFVSAPNMVDAWTKSHARVAQYVPGETENTKMTYSNGALTKYGSRAKLEMSYTEIDLIDQLEAQLNQ